MRRIFFILWCSLLGSSGVVALLRYLQPATFSGAVLPILLGLAFLSVIGAAYHATYE